MPEKSRPSAIPRASPAKRASPLSTPLKRNAPIPLRGTRPSSSTTANADADAEKPSPPRSRIPSAQRFHIPVMHSPAPSSASSYSQNTGGGSRTENVVHERDVTKESDDETEVASGPDDTALSPGFSRILALLETEAGVGMVGRSEVKSEASTSRTIMQPQNRATSFLRADDATDASSAENILLDLHDYGPTTPRAPASAIGGRDSITDIHQEPSNTPRGLNVLDTPRASLDASHPNNFRPIPSPPQEEASGPYAILHELEALIGPRIVAETVDLPRILCAHDACPKPPRLPFSRRRGSLPPLAVPSAPLSGASVFGVPLCTAARYASCSTVLGGQTHMLPIVVFAAVEELYRAGLTSPHLLRPGSTTNGTTLPALVATFDTGPTYGDNLDLSSLAAAPAPLDDVSALLLTYLDCLPGPIIVRPLLPALLRLAVRAPVPSPAVPAAQLLLRLLPAPHFSLLVYLLAFLAQVPMYRRENGWTTADVAHAFARAVCGVGDGDGADGEGEGAMVLEWLLRNWDALSAGLFPGATPQPLDEQDDLGARIAALEEQHAAAVRAAYEAGAAAERTVWAGEVQALREAWVREGRVVNGIVRRFAEGAPVAASGRWW